MPPKPKLENKGNTNRKAGQKGLSMPQEQYFPEEDQEEILAPSARARKRSKSGFFQYIKNLFGYYGSEYEETSDSTLETGPIQEAGNDIEGLPEQEEEADIITQAAVGGSSVAWTEKTQPEDYVTKKPSNDSFLISYEKDYNEAVKKPPVFESSAFFHSTAMHSYMGLRYSRFDAKTGLIMRKRIGIGFASQSGTPLGVGKLNNEDWNATDGSSETPISISSLERVFTALEDTDSNIEQAIRANPIRRFFSKMQVNPNGFGGKYNVLTNNCNDFVLFMAKKAGIELPQRFHDSMFGPMVAYKNLRLAAENGEMSGGTRIFFANAITGKVSDTTTKKSQLLGDFYGRALFGASKDGIKLDDYPEFNSLLRQVHDDATTLFNYAYQVESGGGIPDVAKIPKNLEEEIARITTHIRRAVEYNTGKRHPKITRYLLQVEAIAREWITSRGNTVSIDNYTDLEKDYALNTLTDAEKAASEGPMGNRAVADTQLFEISNLQSGTVRATGNLLLAALGLGNMVALDETGRLPSTSRTNSELDMVVNAISGDRARSIVPFIKIYVGNRDFLSTDQIGKLLVYGLLQGMGQRRLAVTYQMLWNLDAANENYGEKVETFTSRYLNARENGISVAAGRQANMDKIITILETIKAIIANVRDEARVQEAI